MLILSITGKCNYACTYCYAAQHNQKVMSLEVAIAAIKQVAGEPFTLQFTGGEPLIYFKRVAEIIDYIRTNDIPAQIQIQTNGSLITPEIAKYLKKNRCGIGISLDGDPKINGETRPLLNGQNSTAKTVKGIQTLKEQHVACGVTCVVTKENVQHLDRIVDMAFYLGNVRRIGFNLLKQQGRANSFIPPDDKEIAIGMDNFFIRLNQLKRLANVSIDVSQIARIHSLQQNKNQCFDHCYAMTNQGLFVTPDGEYYACASLADNPDYRLGSVKEGILPQAKQNISRTVKIHMETCFNCKDLDYCGGGCFARWVSKSETTSDSLTECVFKRKSIDVYKSNQQVVS